MADLYTWDAVKQRILNLFRRTFNDASHEIVRFAKLQFPEEVEKINTLSEDEILLKIARRLGEGDTVLFLDFFAWAGIACQITGDAYITLGREANSSF